MDEKPPADNAANVLISPQFEKAFPHMARKAMYFGVRCVGFDEARQVTLALMLAAWNQDRAGDPDRAATSLTAPELHDGMRTIIVKNWLRERRRADARGALYAAVAEQLDLLPEEFRLEMIDEQQQLRRYLEDEDDVATAFAEDDEPPRFDPDIEQITDFMTDALSEEDDILVQHRLTHDPDFFEKAWPLLRAWQLRITDEAFDDSEQQRIDAWAQKVAASFDQGVPGGEPGRWRRAYFLSDAELQALWKDFQELAPVTPSREELDRLAEEDEES